MTSPNRERRSIVRVLWVSFCIVIADQVTKLLVKGVSIPVLGISIEGLQLGSSRPIIGDLVRLTYIENPGMAFGIDLGGKLFFSIFTLVASVGILLYLIRLKNERFLYRLALAIILGGACGNLVDRIFYGAIFDEAPLFYGKVIDFIDVDFFNVNLFGYQLSRWPVFNIADASVTVGVLMLLFVHRSVEKKESLGQMSSVEVAPQTQPSQEVAFPPTEATIDPAEETRQTPQL